MSVRNRITCILSFILATLLLPEIVRADVTGSILGVVRDRTNAVVVGARVVATNVETNFSKAATSGPDGTYRILALPAGTYKVAAEASGFERFTTTDIDVKVNDQLRIDVTLDVGSVQNQVSVEASAVQVETESTQLGDVIESQKMLSLPLNGRSYLDLLGLQAGVVPITSGVIPGDRSVSGMFSNPGNVSVNGQRETANAFLVNGGDVSEGRNLGAGLIPNLDSIAEFRLITNSFDAEYGKFSGAVMNAITKSGTNGFHGDAFEFLRNDAMDARNFFDPTKGRIAPQPVWLRRGRSHFSRTGCSGSPIIRGTPPSAGRLYRHRAIAHRRGTRRQLQSCGFRGCQRKPYDRDRQLLGAGSQPAPGLWGLERGALQPARLHADLGLCFPRRRDSAVGVFQARSRNHAVHSVT